MKGILFPTVIILLLVAILSVQLLSLPPGGSKVYRQELRELAAVLEQQELYNAAIEAYESYLENSGIPSAERANILYRIGQIYQESLADYENAMATFLRIRELYPQARITVDARRRVVQCLEALHRTSDARRQMRAVSDIEAEDDEVATGPVVAKIEEQSITMGQLDREIEKLPPALRSQYDDPSKKLDFLQQYVLQELLYDMGERKGYEKDREIRKQLRDVEERLIIQKVYQEEISAQVTLDPSDYDLYYQAHKEEFKEPARIGVAHIQLSDEETAAEVMKRLENGENFGELARELSVDSQTKEKNGALGELRVGSTYVPGLGSEPVIAEAAGALEIGAVTGPVESTKGWHILTVTRKAPERQRELEEIKSQIEFALRRLKEEEKGRELMKRMLDAQKVRIFADRFPTPAPTPTS